MDKNKLIETAQKQLATREQALKATLEEIELLQAIQASGTNVLAAIAAARTKRDRQNTAVAATKQVIDAITSTLPKRAK